MNLYIFEIGIFIINLKKLIFKNIDEIKVYRFWGIFFI